MYIRIKLKINHHKRKINVCLTETLNEKKRKRNVVYIILNLQNLRKKIKEPYLKVFKIIHRIDYLSDVTK